MKKSKQVLETIYDVTPFSFLFELKDCYDYIEKNLEILDILKPMLQAAFIFKESGTEIGRIYMSKDVEKIIKEWLEDE